MKEGVLSQYTNRVRYSTFLNITHNLKITERCFRYLLNVIKEDGDIIIHSNNGMADEVDIESALGLCLLNADLLEEICHCLKLRNDGDIHATQRSELKNATINYSQSTEAKQHHELDNGFRESIVELMILALQCWEQSTKQSKIELAEQSNIWKVNIDGGRLRVRSMDRYLGLNKLPKMPRWRDVIKTAYFVLDRADCKLPITKRLENTLEHTLSILRKQSL